jgi:hypothetical protein
MHCIPLRRQYPVVVHAVERLQNQGDDKTGQFLASIISDISKDLAKLSAD